MSIKPIFSGEILFRRWSDSSTQGVQVTFALADASELEPLKAMAGRRFACVLVPINDDETLQEQPMRTKRMDTRGPYCREACDLCRTADFRLWIAQQEGVVGGPNSITEDEARDWLLSTCGGITSRKELDADPIASELFIARVRVPFMKWQSQQRRAA